VEELESKLKFNQETIEAPNLCDRFSDHDLKIIAGWTWDGFCIDKASRRDWEKRTNAAMDLALQVQESKNFPWPNCSNIVFPLVSIAALQFSTKAYSNLIRGNQVYKYQVVGADPHGQARKQAGLIGRHMSWQVLNEDQAWEEQHNRLFINVAIVGQTFIKTRFSPSDGHNTSRMVTARNLVFDYFSSSVETCSRKTEIIPITRNEIYERCKRGVYHDVTEESWFKEAARVDTVEDVGDIDRDKREGLTKPQGDKNTPFTCLEQHCWMDCDGDGYAEPYIVLMESASRCILRIVARVEREEDVERDTDGSIISIRGFECYTGYTFIPDPDGSAMGKGFGTLLGPLNEAVNSAINQIFDAGTSNMLGGGFALSGAKMKAGVYTRTPGEYKVIKGAGDDVRKMLQAYPEIPIPEVMFKLLGLIIQYADRLAGSTETVVGENPGQNTPAQTYQGMLEQGTQVYKSIFKSIWRSMKEEGRKLHQLNARYLPQSTPFGKGGEVITREAYKSNADFLIPIADPDVVSDAQRINRAMAIANRAHQVPGYNVEEAEKDFLEAIGHDDVDRVFPGPYSEFYQKHPLPNPKVQQEQMKVQGIQMKLQFEKWKVTMTLMQQQKQITAQIDLLRAQAAKLIADIGAQKAATQLEAFDTLMTHMTAMAEAMNQRIEALNQTGEESGDQASGSGGNQSPPSGQGSMALPAPASGQSAGAVG